MLTFDNGILRLPAARREFLRLGCGMALGGLTLPPRLTAGQRLASSRPPGGQAKTCILVYLLGGPPHQDTFDLKPEAPVEVRGPFQPIATTVPGVDVCEHLPRLAREASSFALLRSVSHPNNNHTPMIYYTLTGRETARPELDNDVRPPQRSDFPHVGAVLARFRQAPGALPGYIAIPEVAVRSSVSGEFKRARTPLRGGGAGFLGAACDPLAVNGDPGASTAVPALALADDVSPDRFERRAVLLSLLDHAGPRTRPAQISRELQGQAVLLTGAASRGGQPVFSLDGEPPEVRERYGRHRFGESMLLARRLAEAHMPMVAIHFNEMTVCDGWDTHSRNFEALEDELLPMLDQGLSALIGDLRERGLFDQTLVVCLGEFGRTPKINANAGRDHWGYCSSALLAGGGIRGGQVIGASDKLAAYPRTTPIDPADIHATIYHCLGLDPHAIIRDQLDRPWAISTGRVITELV